jgi:hypothetical protein
MIDEATNVFMVKERSATRGGGRRDANRFRHTRKSPGENAAQFFEPVVAMPWMNVFCAKKNSTMIGITVTALAAMR